MKSHSIQNVTRPTLKAKRVIEGPAFSSSLVVYVQAGSYEQGHTCSRPSAANKIDATNVLETSAKLLLLGPGEPRKDIPEADKDRRESARQQGAPPRIRQHQHAHHIKIDTDSSQ
jgi:hypothetical protein